MRKALEESTRRATSPSPLPAVWFIVPCEETRVNRRAQNFLLIEIGTKVSMSSRARARSHGLELLNFLISVSLALLLASKPNSN